MTNKTKVIIVASVILLGAGSRLVDHPYNFTPIVAMSIFAGCYLRKFWGIFIPLGAMLVSDYFIGFYEWPIMASVYLSIVLAFFVGLILRKYFKWYNAIFASLFSSTLFYLITNFAVWAFASWYPHNFQGLLASYILALPFFRNTLLGDLTYTAVFFGLYEAVLRFPVKKLAGQITKNQPIG